MFGGVAPRFGIARRPQRTMIMSPFRICLIVAALCVASSSSVRAGDRKLAGTEIEGVLTDKIARGETGGKPTEQVFAAGGVTTYTVGGASSQGRWTIRGDQYCSQWPPGESWSCYDLVTDGTAYAFISASGQRSVVIISD
jgi:hypothetical protein